MRADIAGELEQLYREEGAKLWRAVALYSADPEIASDSVAEAFVQALARGEAVRSQKAWVWRASFRIAAGELKRKRGVGLLPELPYEMKEAGQLAEALAELSPKQRAVLVLHYYAGYSQKEIGEILRSSASTVGVHLHRARKRLKGILEANDDRS